MMPVSCQFKQVFYHKSLLVRSFVCVAYWMVCFFEYMKCLAPPPSAHAVWVVRVAVASLRDFSLMSSREQCCCYSHRIAAFLCIASYNLTRIAPCLSFLELVLSQFNPGCAVSKCSRSRCNCLSINVLFRRPVCTTHCVPCYLRVLRDGRGIGAWSWKLVYALDLTGKTGIKHYHF